MKLKFGQWAPDLPSLENPGALVAKNVIPERESYRSMRALQSFSNALDGIALESLWARADNGDIFNFAGDSTKLYRLDANVTWTNVSQAGNYTALTWDLNIFGDRVLAATPNHPIQYYDLGVSTLFADLPNAPNAELVCVIRDFVIAGAVAGNPLRVDWSGLNNSEQWGTNGGTQSGSQIINGRGGHIQKMIGGDIGYLFQERAITRMDYVGPPVIFRFDEIESARGTPAGGSVVHVGAKVYYYSADGFYVVDTHSDSDSTPIGTDRVNQWFRNEVSPSEILHMVSAVDRQNSLVLWAFRTTSSITYNDRLLMYNWQSDRWAYSEVDLEIINERAAAGLSLDELDTVLPGGIDADSIPVDDEVFAGGAVNLFAFNTSHEAATFAGDVIEYEIDTTEFSQDDRISFVNAVRPLLQQKSSGDISIVPIVRDRIYDNPVEKAEVIPNAIGECDIRQNARYFRFRLKGTADLAHAIGVEFNLKTRGRR